MICPFCGSNEDRVIDSRAAEGGKVIRRRRQCADCEKRFTTYERVEQTSRIAVVKRDGKRVPFDRDNIARGLDAACGKRPVSEDAKQRLVDEVEEELHREFDREVSSQVIGERVMAKLRDLDEVAYIRFASEYHQFKTVDDIMEELKAMTSKPKDVKNQQGLFP